MERINQSNSQAYNPSDVLISNREPFNKNTYWIHPHNGIIETKVFNKGWKVISTTEDKGLSIKSVEQVENLVETLQTTITAKLKKQTGKYSSDLLIVLNNQKELEKQIKELNKKIEKLTKRQQTMLLKLENSKWEKINIIQTKKD